MNEQTNEQSNEQKNKKCGGRTAQEHNAFGYTGGWWKHNIFRYISPDFTEVPHGWLYTKYHGIGVHLTDMIDYNKCLVISWEVQFL